MLLLARQPKIQSLESTQRTSEREKTQHAQQQQHRATNPKTQHLPKQPTIPGGYFFVVSLPKRVDAFFFFFLFGFYWKGVFCVVFFH
jgi:hypothetical protein